jgi:quercetin dioxygenase-like cupin family protein
MVDQGDVTMPIIPRTDNERFELEGTTFHSLVRPASSGSEQAVWRVVVSATEMPPPHTLDRDEVLVVLSGAARAHLDGTEHPVAVGDTIFVPAGTPFALCSTGGSTFEALAVLPAGTKACLSDGEPFVPPWVR